MKWPKNKHDVAELIRGQQNNVDSLRNIVSLMYFARGGGYVTTGLSAISAGLTIANILLPRDKNWHEAIESMGLDLVLLERGAASTAQLLDKTIPYTTVYDNASLTVRVYKLDDVVVAVTAYYGSNLHHGPLIPRGTDAVQVLRDHIFQNHAELQLLVAKSVGSWSHDSKIEVSPLDPVGSYVSRRTPEWYIDKLRGFEGKPRTVLIRGPSGVGKSVLARRISMGLKPNARILKISSQALLECPAWKVQAAVESLQPTVLLLDDVTLDNKYRLDYFLDLLECLRSPNTLTIATTMTKPGTAPSEDRGSLYIEGMRPGRVDETFVLEPPDEEDRMLLFQHYLEKEQLEVSTLVLESLAHGTVGMTGAFLKELVLRVAKRGEDDWEYHLKQILRQTPPLPEVLKKQEEERKAKEAAEKKEREGENGGIGVA